MNKILAIWGAGGHGKVILDIARSIHRFDRIVFLDDDPGKSGAKFCDCDVIGGIDRLRDFGRTEIIIAIGDNRTRARCFKQALKEGHSAVVLIHPSALLAPSASIGPGTAVMPGAIVNAGTSIGENCILNTASVVEHDCIVGEHVHVSPRAALGGNVRIGPFAHIGIGSVVLPGATIGEESIVGAGAVVLKQAPAHCTMIGVPAKTLTRK